MTFWDFADKHPVLATCAFLLMLASLADVAKTWRGK